MAKLVQSKRTRVPISTDLVRETLSPHTTRPHPTITPGASAADRITANPRITPGPGIRVEAIQVGYFDHTRRRLGDVFSIHTEQEFSKRWMRKVSANTPLSKTLPNEAIRREHDAILGGKRPAILTGPDDVADDLPRGTRNPLGD